LEAISRALPLQNPGYRYKATREVLIACRTYRKLLDVLPNVASGAAVRSDLVAIQRAAEKLHDRLSNLRPEVKSLLLAIYEGWSRHLPPGADVNQRDNMLWLTYGRRFAPTLAAIAAQAIVRVKESKTRSDRDALDDLVTNLGQIWKRYTGRPFTRTNKGSQRPQDFIMTVRDLMQVDASPRQIDNAMRIAVAELRQD
jgi:hypothetical protein